jgi:hypothetical protein
MAKECYAPEPQKPRLVWSGREKRVMAAPLLGQVVEIVIPQHAAVRDVREWRELRRAPEQVEQVRLPGLRGAAQLGLGEDERAALLPAHRFIWTDRCRRRT